MRAGSIVLKSAAFTLFLLMFWVALAASIALADITIGLVCVLLTLLLTWWLLGNNITGIFKLHFLLRLPPFIVYLSWIILKANISLMLMVVHPNLPISPRVVRFKTRLNGDFEKIVLANSISLTPGTVTINVEADYLTVHCVGSAHTQQIRQRKLEAVVAWLFRQKLEPVKKRGGRKVD